MRPLTPSQGNIHLGAPARIEKNLQRHDGQPLAQHALGQLVDFPPVKQKLSRPARFMIKAICLTVFGDISVEEEELTSSHDSVGVGKTCTPSAQRFHFRPFELYSSFV